MAERKRQTLRRKLFLARKAAEAVEKRGTNTDGDYTYARAEDVLAEAGKQLEKRDILIIPSLVDEKVIFGKAGQGAIATATIEFEVFDTKTDESLRLRWSGTGHDIPGDKALFKATTGATKYFLANLLGIPFGTDPEAESSPVPEADRVRQEQDAAAEAPDTVPRPLRPLPDSDLPEPDWQEAGVG